MNKLKSTINNLLKLNEIGIISNNIVLLYFCYYSKISQTCSMTDIKSYIKISPLAIVAHTKVLEKLGLLVLTRSKGHKTIVKSVKPLLDDRYNSIINDEDLINELSTLKDKKFTSYHSKYSTSQDLLSTSEELAYLNKMLPVHLRLFCVTSKSLKDLKSLANRVEFELYVQWFIEKKINVGIIKGFSMGIFLYPTMITEFESIQGDYVRSKRRLNTSKLTKKITTDDLFSQIKKRRK